MRRKYMVLALIFVLALALAATPAMAAKKRHGGGGPVAKGNFLIGGDFDFSLDKNSTTIDPDGGEKQDTDTFNFGIDALGGYFLMHGLELGGVLMVDYSSAEDDDATTKDTTWAIGPQVGYFYPLQGRFTIFGMLPLGYLKTSTEVDPDAANAKTTSTEHGGFFFEPRAGVAIHLVPSVALAPALYFRYYSGSGTADDGANDTDFDVKSSEFGLKIGIFGFL